MDNALFYCDKVFYLEKNISNLTNLSNFYSSVGEIYLKKKNYSKALEFISKGLHIANQLNSKSDISLITCNLGKLYLAINKFDKAKAAFIQSLNLALKIGALKTVTENYECLFDLLKKQNKFKEAIQYYEFYNFYKDSIKKIESIQSATNQEIEFEHQKKLTADSITIIKEKKVNEYKIAKQNAELKIKSSQQKVLVIGLFLVITFIIFIYNRFKKTEKQKIIIENQKELVDIKNKQITDSIRYAEKIQEALLPNENDLKVFFPESFIYNQPKDIVSGDFFWFANLQSYSIFALADCTGHGVPGGFLTMLGSSLLNEIILEKNQVNPGKILNHLDEKLKATFKNSVAENASNDGMDIILLSYHHPSKKLTFSGAKHPLYVIQKNQVSVYKTNTKSIGAPQQIGTEKYEYVEHTIDIEKTDEIYIFSDGVFDQFGGEESTKFGKKRFLELIVQSSVSMTDKSLYIRQELLKWKEKENQIDDQLLVGIKF